MSVVAAAVVGSGLVGAYSASKAAGAQKDAAQKGANIQREMFNRTDALQGDLYDKSIKDIASQRERTVQLAGDVRRGNIAQARGLRSNGRGYAQDAYGKNSALAGNALRTGLGYATDTRDQNLADYQREETASLEPFQHTSGVGHNALDANAFNLGIGSKPAGYTGLELSPGAKFALEQGRTSVEGGAAARGQLDSGATLEALEKLRSGTVMGDRDNQQAQLLALAGLGNSADQSMAGIRSEYSGRRGDARDTFAKYGVGLQGDYADRMTGNNNALESNLYGIDSNYAGSYTGANDAYGANKTSAINFGLSNLLNARSQRSNLYGSAATQYANGATNAFQSAGDASAAGSVGVANALSGTANNLAWLGGQGQLPTGAQIGSAFNGIGGWLRGAA